MEELTLLIPALLYLNNNGGKEVVKKGINDFYDWFKDRLSKRGKEKLETLKAKPTDKSVQKELSEAVDEAKDYKAISAQDLKSRLEALFNLLKVEDPEWLKESQSKIKKNTINITGNKNTIFQDVNNSQIHVTSNIQFTGIYKASKSPLTISLILTF